MTYFVDNHKTLSISMTDTNSGIDFENDFFEVGGLSRNERGDYIVDDVEYLVEQAEDYRNCRGDFADCEKPDMELHYNIVVCSGLCAEMVKCR